MIIMNYDLNESVIQSKLYQEVDYDGKIASDIGIHISMIKKVSLVQIIFHYYGRWQCKRAFYMYYYSHVLSMTFKTRGKG